MGSSIIKYNKPRFVHSFNGMREAVCSMVNLRLIHSGIGRKRYIILYHILSSTIKIWGESKLNAAPFIEVFRTFNQLNENRYRSLVAI